MAYPDTIFKAYDVRGIYPGELNEEAAEAIGRGVGTLVKGGKIVLGRDMRLSSLSLHQAFSKGAIAAGAQVDDMELVPIDAVYFATGKYGYDAGVMVTASHNPPEYNGFKVLTQDHWLRGAELRELVSRAELAEQPGTAREVDLWQEYLAHLKSFIDSRELKPFRVVVDAGNGMAGITIPRLMQGMPVEVIGMNMELDGSFPVHPSNPLAPGATDGLCARVKETQANMGVIFDGDTDRMMLVDELGNVVPPDATLLLLAKEFLRHEPGAGIVYNLICSRAVPEFVSAWGGRPIRTAVGFVNVREALIREKAVMGGELSSHYSFRDNYYCDSGYIPLLKVLTLLSRTELPLSQLVREYMPYAKAPETNFQVADKAAVLNAVRQRYADADLDELDGVTVSYPDWWANVRPSNTEPLMRVTVEAHTAELLKKKQKELVELISSVAG